RHDLWRVVDGNEQEAAVVSGAGGLVLRVSLGLSDVGILGEAVGDVLRNGAGLGAGHPGNGVSDLEAVSMRPGVRVDRIIDKHGADSGSALALADVDDAAVGRTERAVSAPEGLVVSAG